MGKPVDLGGYDEDGRAELYFADPFILQGDEYSHTHKILVPAQFIERYQA